MAHTSQLKKILLDFPGNLKFCFAYGSGVFKQLSNTSNNMLDLIFVVRNPSQWHAENLERNPKHYAQPLRMFGSKVIANVQDNWGAKVYYNTLVKTSSGRMIKYGVVSEASLVEDLLDWNVLYLAGRLHKPVDILVEPIEESQLRTALVQNLHSAVHASLLLLPQHFTQGDFFRTIVGLSYNGDFRMIFGEDKNKIHNIVTPQLEAFRELYAPILVNFEQYIDTPSGRDESTVWRQDPSPVAKAFHLNQLPKMPTRKLVRYLSRGPRIKDAEECFWSVAHDPDCSEVVSQCLREIVWNSSVRQSAKGILTAGLLKSVKYSGAKITKMLTADPNKIIDTSINTDVPKKTSKSSEKSAEQ